MPAIVGGYIEFERPGRPEGGGRPDQGFNPDYPSQLPGGRPGGGGGRPGQLPAYGRPGGVDPGYGVPGGDGGEHPSHGLPPDPEAPDHGLPPLPDQGGPEVQPPGIWPPIEGGAKPPPTKGYVPMVCPGHGWRWYEVPLAHVDQGLPGGGEYPGQGLPGGGEHPGQGLPGRPDYPSQGLPRPPLGGERPGQGLPPSGRPPAPGQPLPRPPMGGPGTLPSR
jgi:hypothetical protein